MRLTEWTHNLLNKLRQGTMRAIQAIGTQTITQNSFDTSKGSTCSIHS